MRISILTMFPDLVCGLVESPVVKRAIRQGIVSIDVVDIKDFASGSFRHIDDSPYGGGLGMIMRMEPLVGALESVRGPETTTLMLSPKGKVFNQSVARELSKLKHLVLVCGHYEGIDYRFESYVDGMLSLGDFILTGGEPAACVVADCVIRLLDGTFKDGVTSDESHSDGLLEYPQYTHPREFNGQVVPEILMSGNTAGIERFNHENAVRQTIIHRPDMAESYMNKKALEAFENLDRWLEQNKKTGLCPPGRIVAMFSSDLEGSSVSDDISVEDVTPKRRNLRKIVAFRMDGDNQADGARCLVWVNSDCACMFNLKVEDPECAVALVNYVAGLAPFVCCRVSDGADNVLSFNNNDDNV